MAKTKERLRLFKVKINQEAEYEEWTQKDSICFYYKLHLKQFCIQAL